MSNNLNTVTRIGAGVRLTETAVPQIIAAMPEGFDPKARGALTGLVHSWACGDAERPAVTTGPKGNQKATDYGRGVDTLVKAVKRALDADTEKPVVLRATLSGEGGGTVTIEPDHPLYALLVAKIQGADVEMLSFDSAGGVTLAVVESDAA